VLDAAGLAEGAVMTVLVVEEVLGADGRVGEEWPTPPAREVPATPMKC
jgi:hypothetical protein